jgi:Tfp pilus assembly protein PilF
MRVSLQLVSRGVSYAVMSFVVLNLVACAGMRHGSDKPPTLADKVAERVAAADKAHAQGKTDQAFDELEAASDLDPASKLPWLRRAQIHFDAHLYGHAITEAQEVLQRDNTDLTAQSILAVSGLRVSADALDQLRKMDEVKGSTRSEAESVAKIIRDALGEPILLPPTAAGHAEKTDSKGKSSRSNRSSASSANVPSPSAKPATQPAATSGRSNPFGALQ